MFEIICSEEEDGDIFPEWGVKQKSPLRDLSGFVSVRTFVRKANYIIFTAPTAIKESGEL